MGLFSNSDTETKRNQILNDTAIVNSGLRNIANLLDNNGLNRSTISSIGSIFENIEHNVTRISTTVQSMSDSQLTGFNVPWIDGRYIGIMMWLLSVSKMSEQISTDAERYLR